MNHAQHCCARRLPKEVRKLAQFSTFNTNKPNVHTSLTCVVSLRQATEGSRIPPLRPRSERCLLSCWWWGRLDDPIASIANVHKDFTHRNCNEPTVGCFQNQRYEDNTFLEFSSSSDNECKVTSPVTAGFVRNLCICVTEQCWFNPLWWHAACGRFLYLRCAQGWAWGHHFFFLCVVQQNDH